MQKREFLSALVGKKSQQTTALSSAGLSPYGGEWTRGHAQHLLSRSLFGHNHQNLDDFEKMGLAESIDHLFREINEVDPPVYGNYNNDPNVGPGETWVDTPPDPAVGGINTARRISHRTWILNNFYFDDTSILQKMYLFWHEHIPIFSSGFASYEYKYSLSLREHAIGNFRALIEELTINPAMLFYLNGNENTRRAPNENYARELLELFTVGRGPEAGPGDYTNYTEEDVFALAKALTGWVGPSRDDYFGESRFINNRHDADDKQLSHRFDNQIISNQGEEEYKYVIDLILAKSATAVNLCRQLHIWFIGADISAEAETEVIQPLAQMLIDNDYEMEPILRTLLASEYFYEEAFRGCIISSPIDFTLKAMKAANINFPPNPIQRYNIINGLLRFQGTLDQSLMEMPEVAGWKAYYQTPLFYQFWINSYSLGRRKDFIDLLFGSTTVDFRFVTADVLSWIASFGEKANDPNDLINTVGEVIFPFPITNEQLVALKEILIPGLPDYEWTVEYSEYLADPQNENLRNGVERKLRALISTMFKMPEFHLI